MRHRNRSLDPRRAGDRTWWSVVFLLATAGVVVIRLGPEGIGWGLLLAAVGMGLMRSPQA